MKFWRPRTAAQDVSRAEVILVRKPTVRPADRGEGQAQPGLLQVVISRQQPRRTHERGEDRHLLNGVGAHLIRGRRRLAVTALNLSSGGMMIENTPPLAIGADVQIALDACDPVMMVVRWVRGGRVGLEFLDETGIVARAGMQSYIIDTIHAQAAAHSLRAEQVAGAEARVAGPRHTLMWLCALSGPGGTVAGRLRNVSRDGALISFDADAAAPAAAEAVILSMGEGIDFAAQVAWSSDGLAGLRFVAPFPIEDLIVRPCAEILPDPGPDPSRSAADYDSREKATRIEYTGLANPYEPPAMDYKPLTLRELYDTLYSETRPPR